jgi:hypothetical protein
MPHKGHRLCHELSLLTGGLRLSSLLGLALVALACHSPEHILSVVAGPKFKGAVVRVDSRRLGLLRPDPYLDFWPLNRSSRLSDQNWSVLRRGASTIPLNPGQEHLLEIVSPDGQVLSLPFTLANKNEPRFINFGFERNGTLACIVYHADGSITSFPAGATLR